MQCFLVYDYSYISQRPLRYAEPRPFLAFWLASSLIVFCIDLIADHTDVTRFGRTLARDSADHHLHRHHTYVGDGRIQAFVLLLLSDAEDVCGILPDEISLGKTSAPRSLDRRAALRCRDYPRGDKGAGVISLFNAVLHGCETGPRTTEVKAMPGDPGRGEHGREMPSG